MKLSSAGLIKFNRNNTETIFGIYTKHLDMHIVYNTCVLTTIANIGIYRRFFESGIAKKYIVFDEGFLSIKNLCKKYKNVEFIEINNKNLIDCIKNKNMNVDFSISNPPWDTKTDLHVEVVKAILEKSEATTKEITAISVMPNDFLKTDEYNKKHSRYRNTKIDTMLDCNDEFSIEDTNNLFGLSYSTNCSILCWKTNGSYDYDTVFNDTSKIKEQKKKIENTIQEIIKNDSIFKSHKEFVKLSEYNGTGYFVPIGTHGANIATEFGLIENNEKAYNYNGKEIIFDKEKFYSLTSNNCGKGIYVSSKNEGLRLLKLFRSEKYMEFQKLTKFSCNGNFRHLLEFCPILKDNEKFISEESEKEIQKLIKDFK